MNIRPTVEFDDKYLNARAKVLECHNAISELTPSQQEQLFREVLELSGMRVAFEQIMRYMDNGGIG